MNENSMYIWGEIHSSMVKGIIYEKHTSRLYVNFVKGSVSEVLETLSEREKQVIEERFGLVNGYPKTIEEVGKKYNVTRERIRQIEEKALKKLRHPTRMKRLQGFFE